MNRRELKFAQMAREAETNVISKHESLPAQGLVERWVSGLY